MIVTDRVRWFLSIRQLIWNLFCAWRASEPDAAKLATFTELERLLFKLIVGEGREPDALIAHLRHTGEIPVRRAGASPGQWEPDTLNASQLKRLRFNDFYSEANHRVGTAQLVRLRAEFAGGKRAHDVLIQSGYVDFFLGEAAERRRAA